MIRWWPHNNKSQPGRPFVYSPTVIMRCFIVRLWFRLDSNRALHDYLTMDLPYNRKIMKGYGLCKVPSRRTFDRRLATLSRDIKNRIITMGELFIRDKIVDPSIFFQQIVLLSKLKAMSGINHLGRKK
ncbi:MAG TPA: hypothetical protein VFM31_02430 [Nitrososphaeraceae archaeon]|nr:hypothetical protein [Nitrososphaeraceae archaeon]